MSKALDLNLIKRADDVTLGFQVTEGLVNALKGAFQGPADAAQIAMPVLSVRFEMANGEARKPINFPLPMVLPFIHALTEFALNHTTATMADTMAESDYVEHLGAGE